MRTFLARMAPRTFAKIAGDMGLPNATYAELAQYLLDRRLNQADLRARYTELQSDKGLLDK